MAKKRNHYLESLDRISTEIYSESDSTDYDCDCENSVGICAYCEE